MTIRSTRVYKIKQLILYACMRRYTFILYISFFCKGAKNMNEVIEKEKIENMIYEIRGVEVMLDSDLQSFMNAKMELKKLTR